MTDETTAAAGFSPLSPPGRFWITEGMLIHGGEGVRPSFSTSVVATAFFGRSSAWLRVKMRPSDEYPLGELVLDGKPLDIRRSDAHDRQFTLLDVERVGRALHGTGSINDKRLASVLAMVVACAVAYGMTSPPWSLEHGGEWAPAEGDQEDEDEGDGEDHDCDRPDGGEGGSRF